MPFSRNNTAPVQVRIGMVNFINTAPICQVWSRRANRPGWQVIEKTPTDLNAMLRAGELDLGFISSNEYAINPSLYRILDRISISATGTVGSVCLLSRVPPAELAGKHILLSSQSQTSVSLTRIIMEEFLRVQPRYSSGVVTDDIHADPAVDAVLVIGDDALRLAGGGEYPYVLDLSRCWQKKTGLPFVFAVWAVRDDFCRQHPETVMAVHAELLDCLDEGRRDLRAISRKAAAKIPMAPEACYRYLCGIEYDFDVKKKEALALFYQYLIRRGEALSDALPLAMFP